MRLADMTAPAPPGCCGPTTWDRYAAPATSSWTSPAAPSPTCSTGSTTTPAPSPPSPTRPPPPTPPPTGPPEHPWQTTLPFPVHVVASTSVTDYFSGTTLTSEYFYHHGYWDGGDREFRGFARVDQRDTLTPAGPAAPYYSPPTETRTWFHLGPVGPETGAWTDGLDLSGEYFPDDPPLTGPVDISALPGGHEPARSPLRHPRAARPGAAQRTLRARRRSQRRPSLPDQRPRLRPRPRP